MKILGTGLYGPKPEDYDGQCERARDFKINVADHCCPSTAELKGCTLKNKNFYTNMVNGKYWLASKKKTTLNMEF